MTTMEELVEMAKRYLVDRARTDGDVRTAISILVGDLERALLEDLLPEE